MSKNEDGSRILIKERVKIKERNEEEEVKWMVWI